MSFTLEVNGAARVVEAEPLTPLVDVLRDTLGLTGAKEACREGFCGSCTVLVDDEPMVSCLLPVAHVAGRAVRTVESVAAGEQLSPLQQALEEDDAVQCGMCFPGMVMTLTALLDRRPGATEEEIRQGLVGNICRCTGYDRIVASALAVARGERA